MNATTKAGLDIEDEYEKKKLEELMAEFVPLTKLMVTMVMMLVVTMMLVMLMVVMMMVVMMMMMLILMAAARGPGYTSASDDALTLIACQLFGCGMS